MVAVSGGVDSVVLLDVLTSQSDLELIVAHFNHGIRQEAEKDSQFVAQLAERHGLIFEGGEGNLGPDASEDQARRARYAFLNLAKEKYGAKAIITAHHQDDLIETAIINLVRGTGPQGIYAMLDNSKIIRPLIAYPKVQILSCAKERDLIWREDETNQDAKYLRNRIRQTVMPKLTPASRQEILHLVNQIKATHNQTKRLMGELSDAVLISDKVMSRRAFIGLPTEVSSAFMHEWLSRLGAKDLDRPTIERLTMAVKTGASGSTHDVKNGAKLTLTALEAQFRNRV